MEVGCLSVDPDRAPEQINGGIVTTGMIGDDAEQVQGVGVPRVGRSNRSQELFRLGEPSGLNFAQGLCQVGVRVTDQPFTPERILRALGRV